MRFLGRMADSHVRGRGYGERVNEQAPPSADGSATVAVRQRVLRHDRRRILRIGGDIAIGLVLFVVGCVVVMFASTGMIGAFGEDGVLTNVGVLQVLVGWVLWLTVFVRTRWPWVPVVAGALLALLGGDIVLLLIGVFQVVVRLSRRQAFVAASLGGAIVVASLVRTVARAPQHNPFSIFFLPQEALLRGATAQDFSTDTALALRILVLALGAAALLVAVGGGFLLRRTRRMKAVEAAAAHQTQRSEALTDQLARESERQMLARELHDTLAHRLSVISLHSGALETSANDPETTVRIATALGQEARASLEDVRSLVGDVRGDAQERGQPADSGRPPALVSLRTVPDLIASVRATGVPVTATLLLEDVDRAPAVLEKAVYRIVQESLTNVMKHAPGAEATVEVRVSAATGAHVLVTNPVPPKAGREEKGPAASGAVADLSGSGGGRGLIGIRERAQLVGGEFFTGVHGDRFVVDVRLPPF